VEAVFPPEIFRIFSDDFPPVLAKKHRKLTGIHRKKFNKFPIGILLPLPAISGAFLQDLLGLSYICVNGSGKKGKPILPGAGQ